MNELDRVKVDELESRIALYDITTTILKIIRVFLIIYVGFTIFSYVVTVILSGRLFSELFGLL
jgi:hypothetical protein